MALVPLEGVTVTAFRWENDTETYTNVKSTTTDATGEYTIPALWQGRSYKLKFEHPDYLIVYYSSSGLQQDLETGSAFYMETFFEDVDVTLSEGGSISGKVQVDE